MRVIALIAILLAGCATRQNFNTAMNQWAGQSESHLVSKLGQPTSVYDQTDGARVVTYDWSRTYTTPGWSRSVPQTTTAQVIGPDGRSYVGTSTAYVQKQAPATVRQHNCAVQFTLRNGVVDSWTSRGGDCRL